MLIDFRREKQWLHYMPDGICGTPVEKVSSYRCLEVSEDLIWTSHPW